MRWFLHFCITLLVGYQKYIYIASCFVVERNNCLQIVGIMFIYYNQDQYSVCMIFHFFLFSFFKLSVFPLRFLFFKCLFSVLQDKLFSHHTSPLIQKKNLFELYSGTEPVIWIWGSCNTSKQYTPQCLRLWVLCNLYRLSKSFILSEMLSRSLMQKIKFIGYL